MRGRHRLGSHKQAEKLSKTKGMHSDGGGLYLAVNDRGVSAGDKIPQ